MILHDWNDEECLRILKTVARRGRPGTRVFVVEHVILRHDTPHHPKLFDIHMMCWGPGASAASRSTRGFSATLDGIMSARCIRRMPRSR